MTYNECGLKVISNIDVFNPKVTFAVKNNTYLYGKFIELLHIKCLRGVKMHYGLFGILYLYMHVIQFICHLSINIFYNKNSMNVMDKKKIYPINS